jgi:gluconate 2-dehydrogenase subunit 3-like protein
VTPGRLGAKRDLLTLVLDTLVPADEDFPESGALALDHILGMAEASAELESLLSHALEAIEAGTPGGAARGFAGLGAAEREDVLRRVERAQPGPFEALVRHAYDGFYSHPATIMRLGLEPGPVQPRGYRIEPGALPDLARVVARGPIYRRT